MNVLVVDIGASQVKVALAGTSNTLQFDSSPDMSASDVVTRVQRETTGWTYDVVSIGYPGRVGHDGPTHEPGLLGSGWVGFDFGKAFSRAVKIVNDAVLQALGAYKGGRMLFLGLGTGLGSALVTEHVAVPLELGELPYAHHGRLMDSLGRQGLERLGPQAWEQALLDVIPALQRAFLADYIVLGGGHSARIANLPAHTYRGGNDDAIAGGALLWDQGIEPHDREAPVSWRVVV